MSETGTTAMVGGAPASFPHAPAHVPAAPQYRWNTPQAWVLALFPLVSWVPPYLVLFGSGAYDLYRAYDPAALAAAAVANGLSLVMLVLPLAFAVPDARKLRSWGHARVAHPAWVLLSPVVYLVVRTVHLDRSVRRGSTPLWVGTAATVAASYLTLVLVLVLAAAGTAFAAALEQEMGAADLAAFDSASDAAGVEGIRQTIEADYREANAGYAVACPGVASIEAGATFTCDLIIPGGTVVRRLAVEIDSIDATTFTYWPITE